MCKGQCPGTAIDRDWRNRSEHCAVWKALFADLSRSGSRLVACRCHEARAVWRSSRSSRAPGSRAGNCGWHASSFAAHPTATPRPPAAVWSAPPAGRSRTLSTSCSRRSRVSRGSAHPSVKSGSRASGACGAAWEQVEWGSVEAGLRACAQLGHSSRSLDPGRAIGRGLRIRVLDGWTLLARAEQLDALCDAIDACDHDAVGALLGYPPCCRSSFVRFCGEEGLTDLTWPAALHSAAVPAAARRPAHRRRRRSRRNQGGGRGDRCEPALVQARRPQRLPHSV